MGDRHWDGSLYIVSLITVLGVIYKARHAWRWGSIGKRDEALYGGGGSLGQRYVTVFKMLARVAVNIRHILLIVKPFADIFQKQHRGGSLSKRT